MSFVNQYRSTTIYGELKVQKYNSGNIAGLLDVSGNALFRGDVGVNGNIYATDGTVDISGNLAVSGNITGTFAGTISDATNSINVGISTDSSNQSFFPTFVSGTTGNLPLKVDSGITYNPSTNVLSCDLSGNVTGNVSGTSTNATNSINVGISTDSSNQSFFPTFVSATTGNLPLKVDSGITYNPSTNVLSCDLSGNVTGSVIGNLTGTASSVNVTVDGTNTGYRIPFLSATSGSANIYSDAQLTYNPNTNVLIATGGFNGTATNATNATNANNVDISTIATNASFYPTFVSATTGDLPLKVDAGITYNPSTNTLTVPNINGTCSDADLAAQVTVSTTNTGTRYIGMFATGAGTRTCLIDNNLTYDASNNILSCDVSGNLTTTTDNTDASFNVVFVSGSGNVPLKVNNGLIYNPSTSVLHTAVSKIDVADGAGVDADFVIPFLGIDIGQSSVLSSAFIKYNPNTETLKVTRIETGDMDGVSQRVLAVYNTDNSDNPLLFFKGADFGTTNSVEATPYHAPGITYNPNTQTLNVDGSITGTCSNATNVGIAIDTSNATFYPTFVSTTTGNLPLKVDTSFNFNPSTNTLTTDNIRGTLTQSRIAFKTQSYASGGGATSVNLANGNHFFITGTTAFTLTLPNSSLNDGDFLYLRKTSSTAFVVTLSWSTVSLINTSNVTQTSTNATLFAGGVFELKMVYRATNTSWYITTV